MSSIHGLHRNKDPSSYMVYISVDPISISDRGSKAADASRKASNTGPRRYDSPACQPCTTSQGHATNAATLPAHGVSRRRSKLSVEYVPRELPVRSANTPKTPGASAKLKRRLAPTLAPTQSNALPRSKPIQPCECKLLARDGESQEERNLTARERRLKPYYGTESGLWALRCDLNHSR